MLSDIDRYCERVDPVTEMECWRQAMSGLFDGDERTRTYPAVDVRGHANEITVTVDLPGVKPEEVNLTVDGSDLTIEGERKKEACGEHETSYRRERRFGAFRRTIRLPFEIERDQVKARCVNGVLHITLPRLEASKPKHITIAQ